MRVQIKMIKVKPGRRVALPEHILELSKSIAEVGLLNPITVDREYTLIAGLHRLEAAKLLGWMEIECTVSSLEGLQAELAELDENFVRSELTAVEFGELLLRRKEIYEALHPDTKKGPAQGVGMKRSVGNDLSDTMSLRSKPFTADTSEKLGVTRRTIERQIRIAKNLTPEARELLRHSDISQKTAHKLSQLTSEQQIEISRLLIAGEVKSVEDYLLSHNGSSEPEPELLSNRDQSQKDMGERLAHGVDGSADGDTLATQTVSPDTKSEEQKIVDQGIAEGKATGQKQKSSGQKADKQKGRKTQRKKNANAKVKKVLKKDGGADCGHQAQSSEQDGGVQSEESKPEPPFSIGEKRFATFEESVADLKDPNKDCSCTPDSFLAEVTEFVKKFYQEIGWFHIPYYEGVFPILSQTQFNYFSQQMDSLHAAVNQLFNHVKKGRINTHE